MRIHRILAALLVLLLAQGLGGCSGMPLEPWVSPYERNQLADPIMSFNRAPVSQGYLSHVYQAREGARGAEGGSGGGCGCN
jgi:hypothetical protein